MRRWALFALPLALCALATSQETDLASVTAKLDQGVRSYQSGKLDEALAPFQEAASGFEQLLQSGALTREDDAYARYFLATAQYYIARIQKDASLFEKADQTFQEAAKAFLDLEIVGEEYVRSQYLRALCSFRLYQLAKTERNKAKRLDQAIGDFSAFLADENVQKNAKDFPELIDNANYYLGYCNAMLGYLKSFSPSTYSNAKKHYEDALSAFSAAKKAGDERLSLAAAYMEACCHYLIARLYLHVEEKNWERFKLSQKDRIAAVEEELDQALSLLDKMISSAGTQKDLQMFGKVARLVNMITYGSVGAKDKLTDAMNELVDLRNNSTWGTEALIRMADASYLNFLIFSGAPKTALTNLGRVVDKTPEALYMAGWVQYIQGDYADANSKFSSFAAKAASARSTRMKEMVADAKFRQAECLFWLGVKQGNPALLGQADNIYEALENPQGEYYEYLTKDAQDIVAIRRFLIEIETSLGKERDVSVFDAAMALAGLQLPRDAEKYINAGKYFLQKGIETAAKERETALRFAIHAFDKVLGAAVSPNLKNKARFMKGVALVKLATVQEKDKAPSTIAEAKSVLDGCTSPYTDEAKYVQGIGYFNINDYDKATPILQQLKGKGHIRAAFAYAIIQEERHNCTAAAKALGSILATIRDRTDYWYQKADLELSKLACRNAASGAPQLPAFRNPPMTYENLVDEEAERARKKREALFMWQRASRFLKYPDIDKLIPDKPPETNVTLEIAIEPPGGEEVLLIDDKEGLAKLVQNSIYKVTLNRGKHKVTVKKKGFYLLEQEIKVSKSERITVSLKKAVRYTPAGELSGTKNSIATAATEGGIFVVNAGENAILRLNEDGKVVEKLSFFDYDLGSVGDLALDGDLLLVTDPQRNQVIGISLAEEEVPEVPAESVGTDTSAAEQAAAPKPTGHKYKTTVIAYGGETYGTSPLSRPGGIAVAEGKYFIADAGNHRVVVFEGSSYRKDIGADRLSHPVDVAVGNGILYVADIGLGKIVRFTTAGEYIDEIALKDQTQPVAVFVSPEGFVFVSDFVRNNVIKYTPELKPLSVAAGDISAPRGIAQVGTGPESVVYVADLEGVTILKGGWDNTYMPE